VVWSGVSKVYSVYYEQQTATDERILALLCKCFQLFYVKGHPVRGTHHGLLRSHTVHPSIFTKKGKGYLIRFGEISVQVYII